MNRDFSQISKVDDLAVALKMRVNTLVYYSKNDQARFYSTFEIKKRSGGNRTISSPNRNLKQIQSRILELLESVYEPSSAAFGGVKKRHIRSNALRHEKSRWVLRIDLEDFYGTITRNRVFGLLRALGFASLPAAILTNLTTLNNVLPQGAPTSPILANMLCKRLDSKLTKYAQRNGLRYTRYFDDLVFSASTDYGFELPPDCTETRPEGITRLKPFGIERIVENEGFVVNARKTRFRPRRIAQYVTGVKINAEPNVSRIYIRNVRAILNDWRRRGYGAASSRFKAETGSSTALKQALRGRIEHIGYVRSKGDAKDDQIYLKLKKEFKSLSTGT